MHVYATNMRQVSDEYDDGLRSASHQFLDALEASDLLQAQLVLAGYVLCGGAPSRMAVDAARAIQMIHVALTMRPEHASSGDVGMHAAQIVLANLDVPADLRLKALSITNRSLMLQAQAAAMTQKQGGHYDDIRATEPILNPIHVGMVLAGADCDATDAVTPYALAMGRYYVTHSKKHREAAQEARQKLTFWTPQELLLLDELLASIKP